MKTLEDYFSDWEHHVFGFGYGTGEEHIIPVLRRFFELLEGDIGKYDYEVLHACIGPVPTWFIINTLGHVDVIEYGTSPRFAWLTPKGRRLRDFMLSKSVDELIALSCRDHEYVQCYPDACNCGPNGYVEGRVCQNPFFLDKWNPTTPS